MPQASVMQFKRIMIIGGPGSGKSWLANELAGRFTLPVYAVDDAVWDAEGRLRPPDEIDALVRSHAARDRWIIEGGNSRTYADRARRADLIILLAPPRWLRLFRVLRRDGFAPQMLRWALRYDSVFAEKDRNALTMAGSDAMTFELNSQRDLAKMLNGSDFRASGTAGGF